MEELRTHRSLSMTRNEFMAVVERLCRRLKYPDAYMEHVSLPRVCDSLATDLWIHSARETADTRALRFQLRALADTGTFRFTE